MMIKNWKSKVSTILIAGLIASSGTGLAFADEAKKEADTEVLTKQEAEVQIEIKSDDELKLEQDITAEENEADIGEQVDTEKEQTEVKIVNSSDEEGSVDDANKASDDALNDEDAALEQDTESEEDTIKDTEKDTEEDIEKEAEAETETDTEELLDDIDLAAATALEISGDTIGKEIVGTWAVDEYTSLKFDEGGQGCMLLPESEYEFAYELEDNKLMIDFVSSRANDAKYTISISDESMILTLTKGAQSKDFTLQRTK